MIVPGKVEGLRRAQALGLDVPAYEVVDLDVTTDVKPPPGPVLVRNAPRTAWEHGDTVSGLGASVRCDDAQAVATALRSLRAAGERVAIVQALVPTVASGFLFTFARPRISICGAAVEGVASWDTGHGGDLAAGRTARAPHIYLATGPHGRWIVAPEAHAEDVAGLGRAASALVSILDAVAPERHDLEVEWAWDGGRAWVVQLQPFDPSAAAWPFAEPVDAHG
ncbi:MAG: hypothetical protein QOF60_595 [Actinomycetota bacterium]|nr:hypothetical protein [Actinomycetota bacterium]